MNWNKWIRQAHRWLSMAFTLIVAGIFATLAIGEPVQWVYVLPLPFLFLLIVSGAYLFALPFLSKRRGGRHAA
jgi:hypothetical protein